MEFVVITGLSGAGKSQAKKIFEDNEYYCIDNLPPELISDFINLCEKNIENINKVALVSDVRNKFFFDKLMENLNKIKKEDYKILFLEASNQTLINRYKETRRTHPLRPNGSIESAISEEREILSQLKSKANYILETDSFNLTDLRNAIDELFFSSQEAKEMNIIFKSFGFKRGIPLDADYVFDVRFLPNPYYIESLRQKTGNDLEVQEYVMGFKEAKGLLKKLKDLVEFTTSICRTNQRKQVVIAIGCTGGHHRSVTFVNKLYNHMSQKYDNIIRVHRDIEK